MSLPVALPMRPMGSVAFADKIEHKTKWTVGRVRSHARHRDRSTTGRWANLRLEEFEDQSGGCLIDDTCNAAGDLAGAPDPEDVAREIVAAIRPRRPRRYVRKLKLTDTLRK